MQLTKKEERNEGKGRKERQEEGPCCLLAWTRSRRFFGLALLQLCFPALLCGSGHVQARATGWRPGLLSKCYVFFTKRTEVPLGKTLSSLEQTSSASCPVLTQLRPGSNTHPPSHTSVSMKSWSHWPIFAAFGPLTICKQSTTCHSALINKRQTGGQAAGQSLGGTFWNRRTWAQASTLSPSHSKSTSPTLARKACG